jgi:hypothetical protein
MSELELNKSVPYLRATLKEALLDLHVRQNGPKSLHEVIRDSRIVETLLLVLDRLEALEGKTPEPTPETVKFQDRSFFVAYAGELLCRPEHRQQAEAAGYEVTGTFQLEPGKNYLKLGRP